MQDNWMCFPTDIYELMSFKEYMKYSCQQMYYESIFNKLYSIYTASENKTDNIWDGIISDQDRLISFDDLLKKSDIETIEEIDKRITFLIELRGRFIIYLLKK